MSSRDPDAAALALLEVPLLYPRHRQLAAAALLLGGSCLEQTDRPDQAAGLYRELVDGYEGAPEASEARRRLERF
jgi:hypothetical protein